MLGQRDVGKLHLHRVVLPEKAERQEPVPKVYFSRTCTTGSLHEDIQDRQQQLILPQYCLYSGFLRQSAPQPQQQYLILALKPTEAILLTALFCR